MTAPSSFTFGIALLPRASADNWSRVQRLLHLTLTSALAQTDPRFQILIAGHDRPDHLPDDLRVHFLPVDWPAEIVRTDNLDRGRKTQLINSHVLESGGGLLMFLDADDWVDRRLVETARCTIRPHQAGGLIESGVAVDFQSLRTLPVPHPACFNEDFHRLCGSSSVLQLKPEASDTLLADPYAHLHEHYRMPEVARAHGAKLASLPVSAAYLVNTTENHSEKHGPFRGWREEFSRAVNRLGSPLERKTALRFGVQEFLACPSWASFD